MSGNLESLVSYFEDIEHHLLREIDLAQHRILIAVAWFTNETLGNQLMKKKGVEIEIIVDDNPVNRNTSILKALISNCIDVAFVKDLNKNYYLMHNKFCVIDNRRVITGSYNWTNNANRNEENVSISEDLFNAARYAQEFRRLKHLEFTDKEMFFSTLEVETITSLIYKGIIALLRSNMRNLKPGLLLNWTNEKIKNKIRKIDERILEISYQSAGTYSIYHDLIEKYGFSYKERSTAEELIKAREDFKNTQLTEWAAIINNEFQIFKIKAIQQILENYSEILRKHSQDENKVRRIMKVFLFIGGERRLIADATGRSLG